MERVRLDGRLLPEPLCLMIGNFDGVHLGHQDVIDQGRSLAHRHGCKAAVLSFEPHPLKVLGPDKAPKLLQTASQKQALLAAHGLDYYFIQTFDQNLSEQDPERFVQELTAQLQIKYLLIGFNFRFGYRRKGNVETLAQLAPRFGFETIVQKARNLAGETISSSRIRSLVAKGQTEAAAELLGRPYFLEGPVIQGAQVGRRLDTPTANIAVTNELLPKFGVYASWISIEGRWYRSISNLGIAPTLDRGEVKLETHLLDFQGRLYGKHALVCLGAFLREEQSFSSVDALKRQIRMDICQRLEMADTQAPAWHLDLSHPFPEDSI